MSPGLRSRRRRPLLAALALAAVLAATPATARVYLSVEEALELAFDGCEVERRTVFLTDGQLERARQLSGQEIESALVYPYVALRDGELAGTAYFDAHRVRTLPETLMVVVDPEGRVERVEILSFDEPPDYLPRDLWYRQFDGEALSETLELGRDVREVTGATLTARATTDAVRRVLALHQAIAEGPEP